MFRNISTAAPTPRGASHLSPRSARSESIAASIPEELDEVQDLDDDISDANELLKSDNSAVSLTTNLLYLNIIFISTFYFIPLSGTCAWYRFNLQLRIADILPDFLCF